MNNAVKFAQWGSIAGFGTGFHGHRGRSADRRRGTRDDHRV